MVCYCIMVVVCYDYILIYWCGLHTALANVIPPYAAVTFRHVLPKQILPQIAHEKNPAAQAVLMLPLLLGDKRVQARECELVYIILISKPVNSS